MIPRLFEHKNIFWVSTGFFFLFCGFGTAHYLIVPLLSTRGEADVATASLLLIYTAFFIANLFVRNMLAGIGLKAGLVIGAVPYVLFPACVATGSSSILYLGSLVVGSGAALLWNVSGQIVNLASSEERVGRNSGTKQTGLQLGTILGVALTTPFLKGEIPVAEIFSCLSAASFLGLLCFLMIDYPKEEIAAGKPSLKGLFEPGFSIFVPFTFAAFALMALATSSINLIILEKFGIISVGVIGIGYKIGGVLTGAVTGWLADRIGGRRAASIVMIVMILGTLAVLATNSEQIAFLSSLCIALTVHGTYAPFFRMLREYIPKEKHDAAINAYGLHSNFGSIVGFTLALFMGPRETVLIGVAMAVFALIALRRSRPED